MRRAADAIAPGPLGAAWLRRQHALVATPDGGAYVADTGNHRVVQIAPTGNVRTVAGTGTPGFLGDGMPARSAQLDHPGALALDGVGGLYIMESRSGRLRHVSSEGVISTVSVEPPRAAPAFSAASLPTGLMSEKGCPGYP